MYVGREILEMGLYDAVAYFNIGSSAVLKLFDALGIPPGKFTETGCRQLDQGCVLMAQRESQCDTKKRRKVLRGLRKRKNDKKSRGCKLCVGTVLDFFSHIFHVLFPC